jgi:thymidylate synthase (FAD)
MRLIKPYYKIETEINGEEILKQIEKAGRTCYKSEDKITQDSAKKLVAAIIKRGHESVLEHVSISVRFICDRGVSHEIVRHRIASFSQESTRYCNYGNQDNITFIMPCWLSFEEGIYKHKVMFMSDKEWDVVDHNDKTMDYYDDNSQEEKLWLLSLLKSEKTYIELIDKGWKPEQARSVLPNSLKTEIVVTANLREWRKIFQLRTASAAHPQMRELMIPLFLELKEKIPIIFNDIICSKS